MGSRGPTFGDARRPSRTPLLVALMLLCAGFLIGRLSVGPTEPQAVAKQRVHARGGASSQRRTLKSDGHQGGQAQYVDPYDLEAFEEAMGRGLAAAKPAMAPGESGEHFYRTLPFQILSWYPRVMVLPNFIDDARREAIIRRAARYLYPSEVVDANRGAAGAAPAAGGAAQASPAADSDTVATQRRRLGAAGNLRTVAARTSTGTFLNSAGDEVLQWLDKRVAALTFLPLENGEMWNVLNYRDSQHYDSHQDSFDPSEFGSQTTQRVATVIVILSDDNLVGGETVFKREGKSNANKRISNYTDCSVDGGYKYKPRAGDAVFFWNVRPDGELDPHALHGGCPVVKGNKWIAVKWIRNKGKQLL